MIDAPTSMDDLDGGDTVVVSSASTSSRTAHLPDPDEPRKPSCGRSQSGRDWSRREVRALMGWRDDWSLCQYCRPDSSSGTELLHALDL